MKIALAALGGLALQFLLMALTIVAVALALWVVVPLAFPALGFGWLNAVGVSGLAFVIKAIYQ